jgi:mannose-6-phosphate isomerase-like protein (cupin superfamily)
MEAPVFETETATRVSIRAEALINEALIHVIHTGAHQQIIVMTLPPDGEIGEAVHPETDQLFVVIEGMGQAFVGEYELGVQPGDLIFVRAGTRHNIVNRAVAPLRLITVLSPPAYPPGAIVEIPGAD